MVNLTFHAAGHQDEVLDTLINTIAVDEGWCLCEHGDGHRAIMADDDSEIFADHLLAYQHVERCAIAGSLIHIAALAIHNATAPDPEVIVGETRSFHVAWRIEVDDANPVGAARRARHYQTKLGTTALVFEVTDFVDGKETIHEIDLAEEEDGPLCQSPRHDDRGDEPRDHPVDQLDYPWNEPGAPFRSSDY